MARFTLPRDLYHGKGALEALKSFTGKKAMICVGGGSMKRFGFLDRAVEYLKEAGMEVELFEGIEPDPSVETVMRGAEAMLKFEPCLLYTSSACNSDSLDPSHVLLSIGLPEEIGHGSMRFTFGPQNTMEEAKYLCDVLEEVIPRRRAMSCMWLQGQNKARQFSLKGEQ